MSGYGTAVKQRGKNGQSTGRVTKACRKWTTAKAERESLAKGIKIVQGKKQEWDVTAST